MLKTVTSLYPNSAIIRYAYRTKKVGLTKSHRNVSTSSTTSASSHLVGVSDPALVPSSDGTTIGDSIRALTSAATTNTNNTPNNTANTAADGSTVGNFLQVASNNFGAEESVEKLARMTLQLSLDLQNGIDYYEHSFEKWVLQKLL